MLYIDIETRSRVDLRKYPVYRYAECPDFQILMAAWAEGDGPVQLAIGEDEIRAIPGLFDPSVTKVAHNAQFERVCFSAFAGKPAGQYLDPAEYLDTMAIALEKGYPGSLGMLAKALGGELKDEAGTLLINYFCKPNRKGEFNPPEADPAKWQALCDYAVQDVETLRSVHKQLGKFPTRSEHLIWLADQRINDEGISVDLDLAEAGVLAADTNRMVQELEISHLTGVENPGSVIQMREWFTSQGLEVPNLAKETVAGLLKGEDLTDTQRKVLELRQELALVASKKFETAILSANSDGRLRGMFRFFGAHTGRWSGRGVQLHNLARAGLGDPDTMTAEEIDELTEGAVLDLKMTEEAPAAELKNMVRPMLTGPMVVSDYSQIEARVLAWLAGETWVIKAFEAGRDIYVETANRMGAGMSRTEGKIATLALGYQGGLNALLAMGGRSIGDDEKLLTLVAQWRRANPSIVQLWSEMGEAFWGGGRVGKRLSVRVEGDSRHIMLPSGRSLAYHGVKQVMETTPQGRKRPVLTFTDPKTGFRTKTYGGRLTENVTQAIARDIMAAALARLVAAGERVIGHVHDEILVEPEVADTAAINRVVGVMCKPLHWTTGLPIEADAFITQRYRKG